MAEAGWKVGEEVWSGYQQPGLHADPGTVICKIFTYCLISVYRFPKAHEDRDCNWP